MRRGKRTSRRCCRANPQPAFAGSVAATMAATRLPREAFVRVVRWNGTKRAEEQSPSARSAVSGGGSRGCGIVGTNVAGRYGSDWSACVAC